MKVNLSGGILENQKTLSFVEESKGEFSPSLEENREKPQVEEKEERSLEPEKTREFAEALNRLFQAFNLELRLTVHEPTREIIARIVNRQTGEVIREIPPERFLDMIAKLRELVGVLIDEIV
ncbi:MAG: flagellar protein FlaG [Candidatus Atribacteria bacterium]|nr:flagellar protein FlaG [Candidatus Atribacteria bacterium]